MRRRPPSPNAAERRSRASGSPVVCDGEARRERPPRPPRLRSASPQGERHPAVLRPEQGWGHWSLDRRLVGSIMVRSEGVHSRGRSGRRSARGQSCAVPLHHGDVPGHPHAHAVPRPLAVELIGDKPTRIVPPRRTVRGDGWVLHPRLDPNHLRAVLGRPALQVRAPVLELWVRSPLGQGRSRAD